MAGRRRPALTLAALALAGAALLLAVLLSLYLANRLAAQEDQVAALESDVSRLEETTAGFAAANAALGKRLGAQEKATARGIATLAVRTLRSVFTLETPGGTGSAWAAWTEDGNTYLVSAAHVVDRYRTVALKRRGGRWTGRVRAVDKTNDLAVVEVRGEVAPPLWQDARQQAHPSVGETLMLVGSPFGLEGTVTTGIVSRVTYNKIQTDSAASPGNSGGPAVDRLGRVVGILLSGEGENLNFVVPIRRACVAIRDCDPASTP